MKELTCFKAYDIRGQLGVNLDDAIAYRIGRAYGQHLAARHVVVGADNRLSSPALKQALVAGLNDAGSDVTDLGLTGTEEIYFATRHLDADGGIQVTASHNPMDYNGMKLVARGSRPISGDSGLDAIRQLAESQAYNSPPARGVHKQGSTLAAYVEHLLGYVTPSELGPLKLVVNAGNGAAGHVVDVLEKALLEAGARLEFIKIHHEPDGHFPNGIPNPLLPERRAATRDAVLAHGAHLGIAWDGDFDRCFLFDEQGRFVEGYYIVGLLAQALLQRHPGSRIIHDPRLYWNTRQLVQQAGGQAILCKTGHAFIKERMRQEDALYGGEMSAHHYFRDFAYCDSGMIPWLMVVALMSARNQPLSQLVDDSIDAFPSSGEINFKVTDPDLTLKQILALYGPRAGERDDTDGISLAFDENGQRWRFNLRLSNTEPVIRLNVETDGNTALMTTKTRELSRLISGT